MQLNCCFRSCVDVLPVGAGSLGGINRLLNLKIIIWSSLNCNLLFATVYRMYTYKVYINMSLLPKRNKSVVKKI